jgi:hypothetical protein
MQLLCIALLLMLASTPQHVRGTVEPLLSPPLDAPPGLTVELRPRDGQTSFHLYESIPLEIRISSALRQTYAIELDYGWNPVAGDVDFIVSPGDTAINDPRLSGYSCCSSRRVFLTPTPEIFRYYLTGSVRFLRPGTYQVQYRTREVFRGIGPKASVRGDHGALTLLSNVLTITILADDPLWDAARLRDALAVLDDSRNRQIVKQDARRHEQAFGPQPPGTRAPRLPGVAATRYYDAERSLAVLDTREAVRERVQRVKTLSVREWRLLKGGYTGPDDHLIRLSIRPDLVAQALEARAFEPGFGVQYGYVIAWSNTLVQRDAPELSSSLRPEDTGRFIPEERRRAIANARALILESLNRAVAKKTGVPLEMTLEAIGMLRRDMAAASKYEKKAGP